MKIYKDVSDLALLIKQERSQGKKIGLSHGVFDLLHPGHIQHFIAAKKSVDILIVSITSEPFVNKGPGRPIFDDETRMSTLAAISAVDFVTVSRAKTAEEMISTIQPDFYFKGSDYRNSSDDPTGKIENEKVILTKFGGEIVFTDEITSSSSKLINSFLNPFDKGVQKWIEDFRKTFSMDLLDYYLEQINKLDIALIGESILDRYTMVDALGKSSKDPILAFNILDTSIYAGGILAIANNCSNWVNSVSVHSVVGNQDIAEIDITTLLNKNINLNLSVSNLPTITKHRYIDSGTKAKVFETYTYDPNFDVTKMASSFLKELGSIKNASLVAVADYGHGLISQEVISYIVDHSNFLSVNVQSNAGNRGFNHISKYPRLDFFTANSRELQIEMRTRTLDYSKVVPILMEKLGATRSVITLGGEGLLVFKTNEFTPSPALAKKVVDKVGAGDSVFAISSLLSYVEAPSPVIGLLSNIIAANEIANLGHQSPLSLGDIRKQLKSLLG